MEIFISWSGERSKAAAAALRDWLPNVIQAIDPFISEQDIAFGAPWFNEIGDRLNSAKRGIICVTPDNLNSPWLMFEAGALVKALDEARVVPLLIGLEQSQLPQRSPISQFQALAPTRENMLRLMEQLNAALGKQLSTDRLHHAFHTNWSELEGKLAALHGPEEMEPQLDPQIEMTAEILGHVRRIVTELEAIKTQGSGYDEATGMLSRARQRAGLRGPLPTNFLRQPLDLTATEIEGLLSTPNPEHLANALRNFVKPEDGEQPA